jgi:multisubunit Na+/H+ antiporter MnhB subunit
LSEETVSQDDSKGWKKFFRKHWNMVALFVVAVILLSVWAVYVFLWFVGDAQSSGLVPSTLDLWTMENLVSFILHVVFWELILVGIPVALAAGAGWSW